MQKPTIHLNGTGRDSLIEQQCNAARSLRAALEALGEAAPNARDYYPQGGDAYPAARAEHESRVSRVRAVLEEVEALAEEIADAT